MEACKKGGIVFWLTSAIWMAQEFFGVGISLGVHREQKGVCCVVVTVHQSLFSSLRFAGPAI